MSFSPIALYLLRAFWLMEAVLLADSLSWARLCTCVSTSVTVDVVNRRPIWKKTDLGRQLHGLLRRKSDLGDQLIIQVGFSCPLSVQSRLHLGFLPDGPPIVWMDFP